MPQINLEIPFFVELVWYRHPFHGRTNILIVGIAQFRH
jgi:hypothetical protein